MCERRARTAASERRYFVHWTRFAVITAACVCVCVHCARSNYNLNICERFPRQVFIHENPLVISRIVHSALRSPHIPFTCTFPFTPVANTRCNFKLICILVCQRVFAVHDERRADGRVTCGKGMSWSEEAAPKCRPQWNNKICFMAVFARIKACKNGWMEWWHRREHFTCVNCGVFVCDTLSHFA